MQIFTRGKLLLFACVAAWLGFTAHGVTLPPAEAVKIEPPLKLDGNLDKPFWQKAKTYGNFHLLKEPDKLTDITEFKIAYDDTWLYFGINCRNPKMNAIRQKIKKHDDAVHTDESVEIFLDPGTNGKLYYHYTLSCFNVRGEQQVRDGRGDRAGWNVPWRSATHITQDGWSTEIAVPLFLILSYGNLDKIRINLVRNQRVPNIDMQGVAVSEEMEHSSWSPVASSFHEPNRFVPVAGVKDVRPHVPFLAAIEELKILPYYAENGKNYFAVEVQTRGYNFKTGKLILAVEDKPAGEKGAMLRKEITVNGATLLKEVFAVPAATMAEREISAALIDPASGEVLQKIVAGDYSALQIMNVYLDRNYYTTEQNAVAVCSVALPESLLDGMELAVKDSDGRELARASTVNPENKVAVSLASLRLGAQKLKLELRQKSGATFFTCDLTLIKRVPQPGCEWKIDQINRVLLNNGKPFFAMGFCMHQLDSDDLATLKEIAAGNFNFLQLWNRATPEQMAKYCDNFEKAGLYMMPAIDDMACGRLVELDCLKKYLKAKDCQAALSFCLNFTILKCKLIMIPMLADLPKTAKNEIFGEFFNRKVPDALKLAEAAAKRKCLLGWWIFDEPDTTLYFDQWKFGKELYDKLNNLDGYHPVGVNYSSDIPDQKEATSWMDILMTDPYWVPAGEFTRNTPNFVSTIAARTWQRGAEHRQPAWSIPLAPYWSGSYKRLIMPDEQYCQTYLAAIYGATGIMYFAYGNIHDKNSWDAVCEMARQFKTLGPACVAPGVKQKIIYQSRDAGGKITTVDNNPAAEKFADIQASLKRNPDGGYILMAANSRYYPVACEIRVAGLDGKATRLFATDSYTVKDSIFKDTFERYGIRAYAFDLPGVKEPVQIEITAIPPEKIPPPEKSYPWGWRENHKNELNNPSFEETSVKGCPDYYWYAFPGKRKGPFIGEKDAVWGIDYNEAKFGKKSLRIKTPSTENNASAWVYGYFAPQNPKAEEYVFSVWLKGSPGGLKVTLGYAGFSGAKSKEVTVTDQWERYEMEGVIPPQINRYTMFDIRPRSNGILWIDGLQIEKGNKATEFEE